MIQAILLVLVGGAGIWFTVRHLRKNWLEIRARKGRLLGIVTGDNPALDALLEWKLTVPPSLELLEPILTCITLQMLAHDVALHLGRDVDRPRNLAKSVTVE